MIKISTILFVKYQLITVGIVLLALKVFNVLTLNWFLSLFPFIIIFFVNILLYGVLIIKYLIYKYL
jgi:hypothetical protein